MVQMLLGRSPLGLMLFMTNEMPRTPPARVLGMAEYLEEAVHKTFSAQGEATIDGIFYKNAEKLFGKTLD